MPERQTDPSRTGTRNQAIRSIEQRPALFIGLLLSVCTWAIFWPIVHHDFVNYDDGLYVTENPLVQQGLTAEGAGWALQTSHASNWHPLTWLSHMLDCSLFGLFPGGHHLTSLLLHMANTVLLFFLLRRMTAAVWRSGFVAALFAWHPLHVESVAWVAERKDLLSTFFLVLTLWTYVRYTERPNAARYLLALGLFALGLMSKPMLVTLPFLLVLLDYWPLGRSALRLQMLLEKAPFLALSFASCLVTLWAQQEGGALKSLAALPLLSRLANALTSYAGYLRKMIWPVDLAVFYPLPPNDSLILAGASALILAGACFYVWRWRRQCPYLIVGWLWYLGTLVPVIGLVQVGGQSMADRYTYMPLIGLFIIVAWGAADLAARWPRARMILAPAGVAALLACLGQTYSYLQCWQNSRTLFEHAVAVTQGNFLAHNNLGVALKGEGRTSEAISHYYEAVRLNPGHASAHFNLAINLAEQGQVQPALSHFSELSRLQMDDAEKHNIFGIVLAKQGQLKEAVRQFSQAVRRNPGYAKAHYNLAFALSDQGQTAEAIASYRTALRLQPQWPEALQSLAWLLATHPDKQFRDGAEAVRLAEQACKLTSHRDPGYLDTLAAAYAEANRLPEAIDTAESALKLAKGAAQNELASDIQRRLRLYQAGKPFRQAP